MGSFFGFPNTDTKHVGETLKSSCSKLGKRYNIIKGPYSEGW